MTRWNNLVASGMLAASASRVMLRRYLDDEELGNTLAELLAHRFSEAIVDEIQDCCEEDLLVLELLRHAGVGLVVVGDPDQAIYGFRTQSPKHLPEFLATLDAGDRLNGNFRSSPGRSVRSSTACVPRRVPTSPSVLTAP
jgi:DNA helicase-2/ATP-dependent DNA helicase PcrA